MWRCDEVIEWKAEMLMWWSDSMSDRACRWENSWEKVDVPGYRWGRRIERDGGCLPDKPETSWIQMDQAIKFGPPFLEQPSYGSLTFHCRHSLFLRRQPGIEAGIWNLKSCLSCIAIRKLNYLPARTQEFMPQSHGAYVPQTRSFDLMTLQILTAGHVLDSWFLILDSWLQKKDWCCGFIN